MDGNTETLERLAEYLRGELVKMEVTDYRSKESVFLIGAPTKEMIQDLLDDGWIHRATYLDYWEFYRTNAT